MTRTLAPTLRPSTRNVLRIYRQASADELAAGRAWYDQARRLAGELDPANPDRAAAVLAVLSPKTSWPENARLARRAYTLYAGGATVDELARSIGSMGPNARKAAAILWGADPDAVVSGPKVSAFWHTIAHPDDARAVVIDRHAYDVAVGRVTDDATRKRHLARRGGYAELATVYLRAAAALRRQGDDVVTAGMVQAVTWSVWRRHHTTQFHGDLAAGLASVPTAPTRARKGYGRSSSISFAQVRHGVSA